jgi:hypothetical protein
MQSGTQRCAYPREQPFKFLHGVHSRVNNHSLPRPRGRLQRHHMSSNPRRAPIYFRFHRPTRGTGSGGATSSLCLALYVIMFIKLCFNFMSLFAYLSLMWSDTFSLSHLWFMLCNLVAGGLLEVPAIYLGSLSYFPTRGPVLPNGCPSKKLMLMGG